MTRYVCAVVLGLASVAAAAQPTLGQRELALSGSGNSSRDFDTGGVSATGEYGYYYSPQWEVGVRQSFSWSESAEESRWNGSTRIYTDYHFGSGQWRPYLGGSLGILYGNDVEETLAAGPEVGIKFYVQAAAFLFAQMEYQFFFEEANEVRNNFDDGFFQYSFGAGYNF